MSNEKTTRKIRVIRVEYAIREIEVEAASDKEAEELALDKAWDEHYDSSNVYDVRYLISSD